MPAKKKATVNNKIVAKARQLLEFAEQRAQEATDWIEMSNGLFGPHGKATEAFPTQAERTAFCKTAEYKQILALMDRLPAPPVKEMIDLTTSANGAISVRLPRSVHAALLAEAKAEGVSLNQLSVSKLVAQLRTVVLRRPAAPATVAAGCITPAPIRPPPPVGPACAVPQPRPPVARPPAAAGLPGRC
jgi:predicted HicB family RNase H-like nuclease